MTQPEWLQNPGAEKSLGEVTDDIRQVVAREVIFSIVGKRQMTDDEFSDAVTELSNEPSFLAMVEAESIRRAGQLRDLAERSIEYQAMTAATSGWYGYHPAKYGSPLEMLQDTLSDTKYGSGEFYNLRTLVELIVPYCLRHEIPLPAGIWGDNNKSKARHLANVMNRDFKESGIKRGDQEGQLTPALERKLERMLAEVMDPEISLDDFEKKYPPADVPRVEQELTAFDYVFERGGIAVLLYNSATEKAFIQRQFKTADWHLGTGNEGFLHALRNTKKS